MNGSSFPWTFKVWEEEEADNRLIPAAFFFFFKNLWLRLCNMHLVCECQFEFNQKDKSNYAPLL